MFKCSSKGFNERAMHFASRAGEIDKLSKGVGRANKFSICFSRCSRAGEERSQALPRRITSRENRKLSEEMVDQILFV